MYDFIYTHKDPQTYEQWQNKAFKASHQPTEIQMPWIRLQEGQGPGSQGRRSNAKTAKAKQRMERTVWKSKGGHLLSMSKTRTHDQRLLTVTPAKTMAATSRFEPSTTNRNR
jgi:hypothetical protein